jgi:site-specific DNA-methyltransferase (adenine-specific)
MSSVSRPVRPEVDPASPGGGLGAGDDGPAGVLDRSRSGRLNGAGRVRRPTATSRFGVSRRESHDATEFYSRFSAPQLSKDDTVVEPAALDQIWVGDARAMDACGDVADGSVALVVTSPPYYAGKEYETAVGEGHVPASYIAYVEMLRGVFAECLRKLEPGGRIAVNVANLGRKPYRSLSADVIDVLQDLGYLLRGEIVWVKGKAAGGSCAWGSFQRPGNPVFRDLSERVIVASKGRFDRARGAPDRAATDLPSTATISADEFMELTTDVWELPPESATRVGHPAPFPVELPRRLIDLYTYEGDLVLDPFMGSGSTAVAALRRGRHFVGFDTDPAYVDQAEARLEAERRLLAAGEAAVSGVGLARLPADRAALAVAPPASEAVVAAVDAGVSARGGDEPSGVLGPVGRAIFDGRKAKDVAALMLVEAGFAAVETKNIKTAGLAVDLRARDRAGRVWLFDVVCGFSNGNPGLRRTDTFWRALGKASALAALTALIAGDDPRYVLFTIDLPPAKTPAGRALAAVQSPSPGRTVTDVVRLLDPGDVARLRIHAAGDG